MSLKGSIFRMTSLLFKRHNFMRTVNLWKVIVKQQQTFFFQPNNYFRNRYYNLYIRHPKNIKNTLLNLSWNFIWVCTKLIKLHLRLISSRSLVMSPVIVLKFVWFYYEGTSTKCFFFFWVVLMFDAYLRKKCYKFF